MSAKKIPVIVLSFVLFAFSISSGEINTAFNLGGGYNGNLFYDSLATDDSYSTVGGHIDLYPSSSVKISAFGQYSVYRTNNELSNIYGGGAVNLIPTNPNSPVLVVISGEMSRQVYGGKYNLYNQNNIVADARIIYQVASKIHINSKVSYSAVSYINSDYGSRDGLAVSGGFNIIPFGTNTFNFNASYYQGRYDQMPLALDNSMNGRGNRDESFDIYSIANISLRYSRQIDVRTGISVTLGRRFIMYDDPFIVAEFDVDNLSPIGNLWDGPTVSAYVKHYFPHQYTLVLQGSYKDKSYIKTFEYSSDSYLEKSRSDSQASISMFLSKPMTIGTGNILTPTISVFYLTNSSTEDLYDYSSLSASLSMNIRF